MPEVHLNDVKITFGNCFNQKKELFTNNILTLYSQFNVALSLKSSLDEFMDFIGKTTVRHQVFTFRLDKLIKLGIEIANGEVAGVNISIPYTRNYQIVDICKESRIGAIIAAKADNGLM